MTTENNAMLKKLMAYLSNDNSSDFFGNVLANMVANKMEQIIRFRNGMG